MTDAEPTSSVAELLSGHQWLVRSVTLGNGIGPAATFNQDGSLDGMINAPPGGLLISTQVDLLLNFGGHWEGL